MHAPLDHHAREFNRLRERIAAEFGLDADDAAVIDTTDGETDLTGLLVRMVREARQRLADAEVCATQIKALVDRKKRLTDGAEKLRGLVAEVMLDCGVKKLTPGDLTATASLTKPKVEIIEEEALPPLYTKIVRKPDLDAIKDYLAECQAEGRAFDIPGAILTNGRPSLTVRT